MEEFFASHPFAENTKDRYRRILRELTDDQLEDWTAADFLAWIDRPEWGNSQQSVALHAIKKYIRYKFGEDHPALSAKLKRIRSTKLQRSLTAERALDLLAMHDTHTAKGARDLAIAALALDTGLRRAELCRLKVNDLNLAERTLQVIVKGGQWRSAIYSEQTAAILDRWLSYRKPAPGVDNLFLSFHHEKAGNALTDDGMRQIFKAWGKILGIKLSPHDLRRSFATLATVIGAPSRVVQKAGGWSKIDMVERYTQNIEAKEIDPYLPVKNLLK